MNQHEWVELCNAKYKKAGLTPGDEHDGDWEEAHYPLPRGMGDETIWLLHGDHQIQGILQSEETGRCCFLPAHAERELRRRFVDNWYELWDLLEKWKKSLASSAGRRAVELGKGAHGRTPEQHSEDSRRAAQKAKEMGVGIFDPSSSAKGGRKSRKEKKGCFAPGKQSKGGVASTRQVWISLYDGHVSHAAGVSSHNRAIGADPKSREEVPEELIPLLKRRGATTDERRTMLQERIENAINLEIYKNSK